MSDLLSIGSSALLAYQSALATTGHNIANVNTPGYTRQRVQLDARIGAPAGNGFVGDGVQQTTVQRLADSFVTERLRSDASAVSREDVMSTVASRIDQLLSDAATGPASSLSAFFSAMDAVAAAPADPAARSALLGAANTLAGKFRLLDQTFSQLEREISNRLSQSVTEINGLTSTIANLNDRIAIARASAGGQPPNDLLDQRDQALADLASRIGISTVVQDDGAVNVFAAGGHALVLGSSATALSTGPLDGDSRGRLEIYFGSGAGKIPVTDRIKGGEVGGLLDVRREVLDPAEGGLGRIAVALASEFNALHAQGMDLTGALGGAFFDPLAPGVQAYAANTGSAAVTASYADAGQLRGEDYLLRYDGSAWHLFSKSSGAEVGMSGSGTSGDPYAAAGLSFVVSGAAQAGDRYEIRSTSEAAGLLRVAIGDPSRVAAASPVRAQAAVANTGSATVGSLQIADATDTNLQTPVTVQFVTATTYTLNGSGPFAYSAGTPISFNGWSLDLQGAPAAGDQFQVLPNGANSADNGNARSLAALRSSGVLDGGTSSIAQSYAGLVAQVGSISQQAQMRSEAQTALQTQDAALRDSVSGVNLDEEAANLIQFQKSYQAAAQIVATANLVFDSLLAALRR